MIDLASLNDFLLTMGLLGVPMALLVWLARGSELLTFGGFDSSTPPVPEELDPPRRWGTG